MYAGQSWLGGRAACALCGCLNSINAIHECITVSLPPSGPLDWVSSAFRDCAGSSSVVPQHEVFDMEGTAFVPFGFPDVNSLDQLCFPVVGFGHARK